MLEQVRQHQPAHRAKLAVHVTLRAKLRSLRNQVVLPVFPCAVRAANSRGQSLSLWLEGFIEARPLRLALE